MKIYKDNFILNTDSYKISHYKQYPEGTEYVFSYIEARGGKYPATLFFGLQAFIKEYLEGVRITLLDINEAEAVFKKHGFADFNREMWEHILYHYDGALPIRIRAVPEGTVVPVSNVLVTLENTDPKCAALTSYIETALLRAIWYPTTVATLSHGIKETIKTYMDCTSESLDGLPFKLHDFGARGVSSRESAGLGGLAHLVNFMGTDTIEALVYANHYYQADILGDEMPGFSIPAAEHSTITAWGKENEAEAYRNMLKAYGREGSLLAVVSDSYDIYNACEKIWGEQLRAEVIASGATVVIRPDSGHPPDVVLKCLKLLEEKFGSTTNSKNYRLLNNVRVIQGDGIDAEMLKTILVTIEEAGYDADNLAFGCGGGLLQKMDRDTCQFAMKCSSITVNGEERDVFKDPVTSKAKHSKKGRLMLYTNNDGTFFTDREGVNPEDNEALRTVFENGKLLINEHLSDIRARQ